MQTSNLPIIILLLLLVFGCKSISEFGGKKSDSPIANSSSGGKTIEGLETYWEIKKGGESSVMSFIDGRFGLKEEEEAQINGTYKVISDDEVEVEVPGKPSLRITNIKITDNKMTMTINGKNETARKIGSAPTSDSTPVETNNSSATPNLADLGEYRQCSERQNLKHENTDTIVGDLTINNDSPIAVSVYRLYAKDYQSKYETIATGKSYTLPSLRRGAWWMITDASGNCKMIVSAPNVVNIK